MYRCGRRGLGSRSLSDRRRASSVCVRVRVFVSCAGNELCNLVSQWPVRKLRNGPLSVVLLLQKQELFDGIVKSGREVVTCGIFCAYAWAEYQRMSHRTSEGLIQTRVAEKAVSPMSRTPSNRRQSRKCDTSLSSCCDTSLSSYCDTSLSSCCDTSLNSCCDISLSFCWTPLSPPAATSLSLLLRHMLTNRWVASHYP